MDFLSRYKIFRRMALIWCLGLVGYTVARFYDEIEHIGASQATVITAVIGLLSTVLYFYQSQRTKEDGENK